MGVKLEIQRAYAMTPLQEGLLYHSLRDEGSEAYVQQLKLTINCQMDLEAMKNSLQDLVDRYESFRTNFFFQKLERPRMVIFTKREAIISYHDCCTLGGTERAEMLLQEERNRGFDIETDSLIRFIIIRTDAQQYTVAFTFHHIIMDGWCFGIILEEWLELYGAKMKGQAVLLPEATSFGKYIDWLETRNKVGAKAYWNSLLEGFETPSLVPGSLFHQENRYELDMVSIKWNAQETALIQKTAALMKVTVNVLYQTVWGMLLARYNGTKDVVFGSVVSGRPSELQGVDRMVGLFINTIPVRIKIDSEARVSELATSVQKSALASMSYDYFSLADIQSESLVKDALFNHIFVCENYPLDENITFTGSLEITGAELIDQTHYDFNIELNTGSEFTIQFQYNRLVYEKEWVESIASHFHRVIEAVASNPDVLVWEVPYLSDQEVKQLVVDSNGEEAGSPDFVTVHQWFESQVHLQPDEIAVISGSDTVTYRELNRRANYIAKFLHEKGVDVHTPVAIIADRSAELISSVLGVWKAGAAYVPIDPAYPQERIQYMLTDSRAQIIITNTEISDKQIQSERVIDLRELPNDYALDTQLDLNPVHHSQGNDLAYIVYTSGTTGNPKGVMVEHCSLVNVAHSWSLSYKLDTFNVRLLQMASFSFDVFVGDVCRALLNKGCMFIPTEENRFELDRIYHYISTYQISILESTPALLIPFMEYVHDSCLDISSIKLLIVGADACPNKDFKELIRRYGQKMRIINSYGVTEATIDSSYYEEEEQDIAESGNAPIGKPMHNMRFYILDPDLNLVARGLTGELYIGGKGVARGYWNRPEFTNEKFIPNPFIPNERMYRTGDMARWGVDGNVEFIGRSDHQVKIRGYRIELGEIEGRLLQSDFIKEALVVVVHGAGDPRLCGYVICEEESWDSDHAKAQLALQLPSYMIPTWLVRIDKFPLTPNGKIDRKALPVPESEEGHVFFVAPRNMIEQKLHEIWQDVLGVSNIGVNDSFFEVGGHSLKAIILISKISKLLKVRLSLNQVFQHNSIASLAQVIEQTEHELYTAIERVDKQPFYPISSAQRRLLILNQFEDGTAYNMNAALMMEGKVDFERIQDVFQSLIDRHESLRTTFEMREGNLVQIVHDKFTFKLDSRHLGVDIIDEASAISAAINQFVRPFELNKLPLIRGGLIKVRQEKTLLLIDLHHSITDGTSVDVIVEDFAKLYNGEILPPLTVHYKDYASWQQKALTDETRSKQEQFWLDSFRGDIPVLSLMTDFVRPSMKNNAGAKLLVEWDSQLVKSIKQLVSRTNTTLFMVLMAAYNVLLHKYTGQEDIIIGTPSAGRSHADLQRVVGMFVNTLAMRNYPQGDKTFETFLQEVNESSLQAFEHQDYPFEELITKLGVQRDMSRNPLFDTMLVLENTERVELNLEGVQIRTLEYDSGNSKFDLVFGIAEENDRLRLEITYSTSLFQKETIERLVCHFHRILEMVTENRGILLSEIDLLSEQEHAVQLQQANGIIMKHNIGTTLAEKFQFQASLHPERIAVADAKQFCTYGDLDRKTNQMAQLLRMLGVRRNTIVGIMVEPGLGTIIGILSVLKAGGAYLPLDPMYPGERVAYMHQETGFNIVLTDSGVTFPFPNGIARINMDLVDLAAYVEHPLDLINTSSDLAYVIYTSGTTGAGKGVMIEQHSVLNLIDGLEHSIYSRYSEALNIALIAPFVFDASVKQIFASLLLGHTLHIAPREVRADGKALYEFYNKHNIDLSDGTPTHLRMLIALPDISPLNVRHYLIGGEALHYETAKQWIDRCSPFQPVITNVYGPTECTVDATSYTIDGNMISNVGKHGSTVPIGNPLPNVSVYVLGSKLEILPKGAVGDLYIGGVGVARGYCNQQQLTDELFVQNPYKPGERMYKTGDRVRLLPDGALEYLGRNDDQVKVRGYRIETSEVESALLTHPKVHACIVTAVNGHGNTKHLCAYAAVNSDESEMIDTGSLRRHLGDQLPDYMIPSFFVFMPELPTTPNGKIDRRALPEPEFHIRALQEHQAPFSEMESILVDVWEEVLGVSPIGVNHNFFELGGDSIKVIQIAAQLHQRGFKMEIPQLFRNPSIKELATQISKSKRDISQEAVEGVIPLTPIQQRFFNNTFGKQPNHYNQSVVLFRPDGFDESKVKTTFEELIQHHDALRIKFIKQRDKYTQWNRGLGEEMFSLMRIKLEHQDWEAEAEKLQRGLDVEQGPLISLGIFEDVSGSYLIIVIHHLLVDGVSWRIVLEDFMEVYGAISEGKPWNLPSKTNSYQEWAIGLQRYAEEKDWEDEIRYWSKIHEQKVGTLLTDSSIQLNGPEMTGTATILLDEEHTRSLLGEAKRAYRTEINDLLLVALGNALKQWSGMNKFLVELEGHGREPLMQEIDISRTVGWFTSVFPVILDMNRDGDWSNTIRNVKEELRRIPSKGANYNILRHLSGKLPQLPMQPEILFNYLGQFDNNHSMKGITLSNRSAGMETAEYLTRLYALEISGMVYQGRLEIIFTYDMSRFQPSAMEQLRQLYLESLTRIIDHCCSQKEIKLSPSDLTHKSVSMDQLDQIAGLLKQKIKLS